MKLFLKKTYENYIHYRKSLPLVMQDGCKVIYPAMLHNAVQGKAAFEEEETTDSPYVVEVFGPPPNGQLGKKNKNIIIYEYKK